ncbi:PAS domain-containing protein [Mycena kentingensis (nom. inval.)]|nr:PAS domain-containing protein [Mycena kentingensis (nom. inval.)]
MNTEPPSISFIAIMDFSARWTFLSESVSDLLGWDASDLRNRSFYDLVHPEELAEVQEIHNQTILEDRAASILYMRLKHKDAYKGYLVCAVSRTIVCDVIVGSVSFAPPGGATLSTSSTAQDVFVVTPAAANFHCRRWHEAPSPSSSPNLEQPPASHSLRTALILDRFSTNCTVTHYLNNHFIPTTASRPRPFFDFVSRDEETLVRSWLCSIKTCGVNERGQPSNGGFGYGRFHLCAAGRDSSESISSPAPVGWRLKPYRGAGSDDFLVDAIFSAHSDGLVCILCKAI